MHVAAVNSYDLADTGARVVSDVSGTPPLACSVESLPPRVLGSHADCTLRLGLAQGSSASDLSMMVTYTSSSNRVFARRVMLSVYAPSSISLATADSTLNRYTGRDGALVAACGSTAPYQRTPIKAIVDGFDMTPLVSFTSSAPAIAATSPARWDVIEGKTPGAATLSLFDGAPLSQTTTVVVTDASPVSVVRLDARVVTAISWDQPPLPTFAYPHDVHAAARAADSSMTAEGEHGLIFARVLWSDGLRQEVGYAPAQGLDELLVSSGTGNVIVRAPGSSGNSEGFWR